MVSKIAGLLTFSTTVMFLGVAACSGSQVSCSSTDVKNAVGSLMSQAQSRKDAAGIIDWAHSTAVTEAIRTDETLQNKNVCKAEVKLTGNVPPQMKEQVEKSAGFSEMTVKYQIQYEVSLTDDGKTYVQITSATGGQPVF